MLSDIEAALSKLAAKGAGLPRMPHKTALACQPTPAPAPDAPAPRLSHCVTKYGPEPTKRALAAWKARVQATSITDIAHELGLTLEGARALLNEVHAAIREDLKDSLELNRQLDLDRIDALLRTWFPIALRGDPDGAAVTLKSIQLRAKLAGHEITPLNPCSNQPSNVLVWIQAQLPAINRLVDSLPVE
jgi:hypothetical protein